MKTVIVADAVAALARPAARRIVVVLVAVALGGCGGGGEQAVETLPRPTLPRAVADDLAERSDAIADALDAGDVCTAAVRADELQHAVIDAINSGRVPQAFQEDLSARANELVNSVNCPPPPPPTTTAEEQEPGRGKKKGHKKGGAEDQGGDQGGDEGGGITVPTVPTVTGVVP